jgi:hypothetical protein
MDQTKSQVKAQLDEMITNSNGKVFMGMIHHMYGPLRGLNFILNNAQAEDIMNSIDEQGIEMDPELQMKIVTEIKEGREPNSLIDLVFKIWADTGLSPRLMVLPEELIEQAENPPVEVKDITSGCKEILNVLRMTHQFQEKDPHFFRVGII